MAKGYKFTTTSEGVEVQAYDTLTDQPIANGGDLITRKPVFSVNDGKIEMWVEGRLPVPGFTPTQVLEIDEVAHGGDDDDPMATIRVLSPLFPDASGGGGDINFTALTGTVLEGFQYKESTANLVLTATEGSGIFHHKNGASWTLSVNGTNVPTRTSASNGGHTAHSWYYNAANGKVYVEDKDGFEIETTPAVADTTAPTIVSVTATDATHIEVVFSEVVDGTDAGWSFDNGSPLGITGVGGSGTDTWSFTVDTMTSGDTITFDYDATAGDAEDGAGNQLADDSGGVTNSISSGFTSTNREAFYTNATMTRAGGAVTAWTNADGDATWNFGASGTAPIDATTDGLQITATQNLAISSPKTLNTPFTAYILCKKTAVGGLLPNATGGTTYGLYLDTANLLLRFNSFAATGSAGIANMAAFHVVTVVYNGTNPPVVYLDGVAVGTFVSVFGTAWEISLLSAISGDNYRGYLNGLAFFSVAHDSTTVGTQYPLFKTEAEA